MLAAPLCRAFPEIQPSSCVRAMSAIFDGITPSSAMSILSPSSSVKNKDNNTNKKAVIIWYPVRNNASPRGSLNILRGVDLLQNSEYGYSSAYMKLDKIKELGDDWNGSGAKSFQPLFIEAIYKLIGALPVAPEVFPTACGTIQLEYHDGERYLEFEVSPDNSVSMYKENRDGSTVEDTINISETIKVVATFYGV